MSRDPKGETSGRNDRGTSLRPHPVYIVQRVWAALFGLGLWVFAGLGFANGLAFFSTQGQMVVGLSSNGALSTISVVVGAILIGSAVWGGPTASTVTAAIGVIFLISGIVHLGILHTSFNILAFRLPNVFFSLIAGLLLLIGGMYGRVSGGLPPDNPYRRSHPVRERPDPDEQLNVPAQPKDEREREQMEAEVAMGEGHPTPEQQALVEREQARRQAHERAHAYEQARRETPRRSDA
ncbi:uncharacterized protein DUF4383 [Halopolyspora algeriensis]|uniref:Uncharacterized protein DUF4383 n=1 Tax=Halopolyspora algeriensis TaxID=1500506 RepID=A0A368VXX3_9ACTN|nr:DUF4383 domain-containing protein [Halopolyspora algeriensis]RCW46210.1 uncharacterized protein DUF4383 [Halopolyspora algeriensis]TQM55613.1 uncharacterized protein DUF4383 [Halopolyspora algeriensis]